MRTVTINRRAVPVETHPRTGEEYVSIPDKSGGRTTLALSGARRFKGNSSQYPLIPPLEEVVRNELMSEDEPFYLLSPREQRRKVRRVLTAMIKCEHAMLAHDAQPITTEV